MSSVTLITRPGCHLCDNARVVIEQVAADLGVEWTEINVDDDAGLRRQYGEMVPVTLIDGCQHDYFTVDERRLRRALA